MFGYFLLVAFYIFSRSIEKSARRHHDIIFARFMDILSTFLLAGIIVNTVSAIWGIL